MLTRFNNDLWKIAQDDGLTLQNFKIISTSYYEDNNGVPRSPAPIIPTDVQSVGDTLIAFAMQKYYYETNWNAAPVLFSDVPGGVLFDLNDVASSLNDAKGYNIYFKDYIANIFDSNEQASINSILPNLRYWYVQAGSSVLNVADTINDGAFMLGGVGQDNLIGGNQADLLIGNEGSDTLTGGGGADTLIGGKGNDIYYVNDGDTIIDSDGLGNIIFNGDILSGGTRKAGETDYRSADGNYTYQWSGGDLVINQTITIKSFKNDNVLGIHLSGGGGIITTDIDSGGDYGQSVTVQADGKILVAGIHFNYSDNVSNFALVRYNTNGSLDTNFDGDGKVFTNIGPGSNYGRSVTVQADGKILVAGSGGGTSYGDVQFALARYNVDGSLDASFDGDGTVSTEFANNQYGSNDGAHSIALQPDGKILVAGDVLITEPHTNNDTIIVHHDFCLLRYNVDGSLDSSFDGDGIVTTNVLYTLSNGSKWSGNEVGQSVTLQPDGKILVAGSMDGGDIGQIYNSLDFGLIRYNSDGSLDTSFSGDGIVKTPISPAYNISDQNSAIDIGQSVNLQADGKILVAGSSNDGYRAVIALVRYNADGTLDTSFGGDGKVTTDIPDSVYGAIAYSVTIQTDGKILVAGGSDNGGDGTGYGTFVLVRYNTDGSLDSSFDGNGIVTTAMMGYGRSVSLQPDGKILVAGDSDPTGRNVDFALVRYNTDGSLDGSFDGADGTSLAITRSNINENVIVNSIVGKLTGTAADGGDIFTYSLSASGDNNAFTIIGDQLHINNSPNFESKSNYNLTVRMTSQGGLSFDKALTIGINNVNEAPTKLAISASSINENVAANSAVGTLSSTDPDANNTFSYSLVTGSGSADNSAFTISGNLLLINNKPNFTTKSNYNILVRTTDQGGLFFEKALTINIIASPLVITGTNGDDKLIGNSGNNTIYGLDGDDLLNGKAGADNLIGGRDNDIYVVDNAGDVVTENLNEGTDKVNSSVSYTLSANVENLTLTGVLAIDGTGNDLINKIIGNSAANQLIGGEGNDTLDGKADTDILIGGLGNDLYVVDNAGDVVTENLNEGTDKVNSSVSYTLSANVENLTLTGAVAINGTGNNLTNVITGNTAINTLIGGAGNDTLDGKLGNNILTGGAGKDSFKFTTIGHIDMITDFVVIDDTIKLENAVFTALTTTGKVAADQFVINTHALDANDFIIYDSAAGKLLYDADGSGAGVAVQIATVGIGLAMTNADIVVI